MVKVNFPDPTAARGVKAPYDRGFSTQQALDAAGASGVIYGRNIRQRDHEESLRFVARLKDLLAGYPFDPGDPS